MHKGRNIVAIAESYCRTRQIIVHLRIYRTLAANEGKGILFPVEQKVSGNTNVFSEIASESGFHSMHTFAPVEEVFIEIAFIKIPVRRAFYLEVGIANKKRRPFLRQGQ